MAARHIRLHADAAERMRLRPPVAVFFRLRTKRGGRWRASRPHGEPPFWRRCWQRIRVKWLSNATTEKAVAKPRGAIDWSRAGEIASYRTEIGLSNPPGV